MAATAVDETIADLKPRVVRKDDFTRVRVPGRACGPDQALCVAEAGVEAFLVSSSPNDGASDLGVLRAVLRRSNDYWPYSSNGFWVFCRWRVAGCGGSRTGSAAEMCGECERNDKRPHDWRLQPTRCGITGVPARPSARQRERGEWATPRFGQPRPTALMVRGWPIAEAACSDSGGDDGVSPSAGLWAGGAVGCLAPGGGVLSL